MNTIKKTLAISSSLFLMGCATNDFKVVDALRDGMTKDEARSTIASYGFQLETHLDRPTDGWPKKGDSYPDLAAIAHRTERRLNREISYAEYYPVGHGLFGWGELFLFYDHTGRLIHFYRQQIN